MTLIKCGSRKDSSFLLLSYVNFIFLVLIIVMLCVPDHQNRVANIGGGEKEGNEEEGEEEGEG